MFTGIALMIGGIGVMVSAGIGMSAVFSFLHNYEFDATNKKPKNSNNRRNSGADGPNRDRINHMKKQLGDLD